MKNKRKDVDYIVKFIGKTDFSFFHNAVYKCVREWFNNKGELDYLSVIDISGEDYIFSPRVFEKIDRELTDFEKKQLDLQFNDTYEEYENFINSNMTKFE